MSHTRSVASEQDRLRIEHLVQSNEALVRRLTAGSQPLTVSISDRTMNDHAQIEYALGPGLSTPKGTALLLPVFTNLDGISGPTSPAANKQRLDQGDQITRKLEACAEAVANLAASLKDTVLTLRTDGVYESGIILERYSRLAVTMMAIQLEPAMIKTPEAGSSGVTPDHGLGSAGDNASVRTTSGPGPADDNEGPADPNAEIGDFGLVSFKDTFATLAKHSGCTCNAKHTGILLDSACQPFKESLEAMRILSTDSRFVKPSGSACVMSPANSGLSASIMSLASSSGSDVHTSTGVDLDDNHTSPTLMAPLIVKRPMAHEITYCFNMEVGAVVSSAEESGCTCGGSTLPKGGENASAGADPLDSSFSPANITSSTLIERSTDERAMRSALTAPMTSGSSPADAVEALLRKWTILVRPDASNNEAAEGLSRSCEEPGQSDGDATLPTPVLPKCLHCQRLEDGAPSVARYPPMLLSQGDAADPSEYDMW